jgi:hypothetical protein
VGAGSIVPLGVPVENTKQPQRIASIRVDPGADATSRCIKTPGRPTRTRGAAADHAARVERADWQLHIRGASGLERS